VLLSSGVLPLLITHHDKKEKETMMDDVSLRMLQLKQDGFCCTQIMLIMALEAQNQTNRDLIRAAGGLCYGVGMSGEICGALSGGACLISLYAGKGSSEEQADDRLPLMMEELTEWFREIPGASYGGIRCDEILTQHPDMSACGLIVASTYGKAMEILRTHDLNPNKGRDDRG
jgi:C_GCAxxG_C_C family probable redox protein